MTEGQPYSLQLMLLWEDCHPPCLLSIPCLCSLVTAWENTPSDCWKDEAAQKCKSQHAMLKPDRGQVAWADTPTREEREAGWKLRILVPPLDSKKYYIQHDHEEWMALHNCYREHFLPRSITTKNRQFDHSATRSTLHDCGGQGIECTLIVYRTGSYESLTQNCRHGSMCLSSSRSSEGMPYGKACVLDHTEGFHSRN